MPKAFELRMQATSTVAQLREVADRLESLANGKLTPDTHAVSRLAQFPLSTLSIDGLIESIELHYGLVSECNHCRKTVNVEQITHGVCVSCYGALYEHEPF